MSVKYKFNRAVKILNGSPTRDMARLHRICGEIREAEQRLNQAARKLVHRCYAQCEGICCRNVHLDNIFSHLDFIYILTIKPELNDRIARCLEQEDPIFSSDCMFLEHETGPCVFPPDLRPVKCITTFCFDDSSIQREIQSTKNRFLKLGGFMTFRKPASWVRYVLKRTVSNRFINLR